MRRFATRLLQAALGMVQNQSMPIQLKLIDGSIERFDVPEGRDEEAELIAIRDQEGPYSGGWITLGNGAHLRIDQIARLKVYKPARAAGFN